MDLDIQENKLLAALSPEALQALGRELRPVSLAPGTVVYEPGARLDKIYFPLSCLISLTIITENGNSIEAANVGREGAVGLHGAFGTRRSFTRAVAQISGIASVVTVSRFEEFALDCGAIRDLVANYGELLLAEAQQLTACNAVHDAASRLCRWLLQTSDRTERNNLPLTHEFLGQMLGVRRTTVTLLAQTLQDRGMIRYKRGSIDILDRGRIEREACECYHVLRRTNLVRALGLRTLD